MMEVLPVCRRERETGHLSHLLIRSPRVPGSACGAAITQLAVSLVWVEHCSAFIDCTVLAERGRRSDNGRSNRMPEVGRWTCARGASLHGGEGTTSETRLRNTASIRFCSQQPSAEFRS